MNHAVASRKIGLWLEATVCSMVDHPRLVRILDKSSDPTRSCFLISLPNEEIPKIIGVQGRNIHAVRQLLRCLGVRYGHPSTLMLPQKKAVQSRN